jgi:hypothetical protein
MTGEVGILNVGAGDTKLVFDPKKPDEVARSAQIVKDMIRRGFVLLIEVGQDEKGPIYRRAHDFDEATAEYIIAGVASDESTTTEKPAHDEKPASPPKKGRATAPRPRKRRTSERIPASSTRAVAVARTAGG